MDGIRSAGRSLLMVALVLGSNVPLARATVRVVTDFGDSTGGGTPGQLRRLINDAQPGDLILIPPGPPIVLTGSAGENLNQEGDLDIVPDKNLTIQGAGPRVTILDGNGIDRVFEVRSGASLTLAGLTIRGGQVSDNGGGILTRGTLSLVNVAIADNSAGSASGGGLCVLGGTATLSGVTLSGNTADYGGGLDVELGGTATLLNTTVSGNGARAEGGGILNTGLGLVSLANVTITDNTADSDNGGSPGLGGGLLLNTAFVTLRNTLIAGNRVGATPGSAGPDCFTLPSLTSEGYNLIGDATGCVLAGVTTGNLTNVAAGLGPLADNGGPTRTHALLPGSPAIDAGDGACAPTDQRGVLRPQHGRCDIGAYERAAAPLSFDFDGDGVADVVVGAGRGGEPRVLALSGATNAVLLSFLAYDATFRGGVRVAACDLNGDGVPDIVTAPGAGPLLIRVFDGRTGQPLAGALGGFSAASEPGGRAAGAHVACGDVNGDGVPDILVGLPAGAGAESHVLSFSGVDGTPVGAATPFPGFRGEVFVAP